MPGETVLRFSPERAEIVVEQIHDGITSRKMITADALLSCLLTSRYDDETRATGLLPDGCISVTMTPKHTCYYIRYPELYADFNYMGTEYPHFPIPRLVFCFKYLPAVKKVADIYIAVVKDERLTADTPLYRYPFSNLHGNDRVCMGNNALPVYKDPARLHTLASYILRLPNNNDLYSAANNRLNAEYRNLLEQMKGKDPSVYYTDVLVENGRTLKDFMNRRN